MRLPANWRYKACARDIPAHLRRSCSVTWQISCLGRSWQSGLMGRGRRRSPLLPEPLAVTMQVIGALKQVGAV